MIQNEPVQPICLLQIDLAVRDSRSPTGWLFGSYTYDGRNYVEGDDPLKYLAPVGIQWGNDPGITPEMIEQGAKLKEAWVNEALLDLPSNHLGWGGRVAGPADNPGSSCMSCHMTAGVPAPPILAIMVSPSPVPNERYLNWFINIPAGVTFGYNTEVSLDYSLQLSQGLQNFLIANNMTDEMLLEQYSPRGPDRTPPAALAATSMPNGESVEDGTSQGKSSLMIFIALIIGLVVGVGGTILLRRKQKH